MIRRFRAFLLPLIPLLLLATAGPAAAWPKIGLYSDTRWDVPPRIYGYPLDDDAADYYGGARYKEYYGFGRGYALAGYPGPVPNYPYGNWFKQSYWPYGSRELPKVYTPQAETGCAHIILQVPPDAQVWLEGRPTQQTGTTRTFVSPVLPVNQNFLYEVRVRWHNGTGVMEKTQTVTVKAGSQVRLNFPQQPTTEQISFTPKFEPVPNK
jgi:uncharacterized protein (TIGR03000 family)